TRGLHNRLAAHTLGRSLGRTLRTRRAPYFFFAGFRGTSAPFFRALESPMAMACLRLWAFPFLPLFCVPSLVFLTARRTSSLALEPYLAMSAISCGAVTRFGPGGDEKAFDGRDLTIANRRRLCINTTPAARGSPSRAKSERPRY